MEEKKDDRPGTPAYAHLRALLTDISRLKDAIELLSWDLLTGMPKAANDDRSETIGRLSSMVHERSVSTEMGDALEDAAFDMERNALTVEQAAVVRLHAKAYARETRLPREHVEELQRLRSSTLQIWEQAKKTDDWRFFSPPFRRMVELCRQEAALVGFNGSPYDALLDLFDPGATVASMGAFLTDIAVHLSRMVRLVGESGVTTANPALVPASLSVQRAFNVRIAKALAADFSSCRLDTSSHPCMLRIHANDFRITTRYRKDDLLYALYSTVHETGHLLYEQGMPKHLYGTIAGSGVSMTGHESQSLLYENMVGRSWGFCRYLHDQLGAANIASPSTDNLYRTINAVSPSLIRTEADELTYSLHICVRYEIERALIEGTLDSDDVPAAFNEKMRNYLGLTPPDLARGCLQDIHWAGGEFGYFPTYALGRVYSTQYFEAACRDIPGLEDGFAAGKFADLLAWLREHMHRHASVYSAAEVLKKATGKAPTTQPYLRYLEKKYGQLYKF